MYNFSEASFAQHGKFLRAVYLSHGLSSKHFSRWVKTHLLAKYKAGVDYFPVAGNVNAAGVVQVDYAVVDGVLEELFPKPKLLSLRDVYLRSGKSPSNFTRWATKRMKTDPVLVENVLGLEIKDWFVTVEEARGLFLKC